MAHAADPPTMLALARDVFAHAPDAWLLTIPVRNLAIGDELSDFARHNLQAAIDSLKRFATGRRIQAEQQASGPQSSA